MFLFLLKASYTSPPSSSSSSFSILPPPAGLLEEAEPALGLSLSVSNSFLSGHASLTTPVVSEQFRSGVQWTCKQLRRAFFPL